MNINNNQNNYNTNNLPNKNLFQEDQMNIGDNLAPEAAKFANTDKFPNNKFNNNNNNDNSTNENNINFLTDKNFHSRNINNEMCLLNKSYFNLVPLLCQIQNMEKLITRLEIFSNKLEQYAKRLYLKYKQIIERQASK